MKLPVSCPSCQHKLQVKTLHCDNCQTQVDGNYSLPLLASLPDEAQAFILEFVKSSGSLKEMAKSMSLSYPTVRNRLDEIINLLHNVENEN
jgi:hypothetical protein